MKSMGCCSLSYSSSVQEHDVSCSDFLHLNPERTDGEKHDEEITGNAYENEDGQMGEEATVGQNHFPMPTLRAFCQQLFTVTDSNT